MSAFLAWLKSLFDAPKIPIEVPKQKESPIAQPPVTELEVMMPPAGTSPVPVAQLQDNAMKYERCTIDPNELSELKAACDLIEKIERETKLYSGIEAATGVDRDAAAAIHYRESSCSTKGCFQNGDPCVGPEAMAANRKTVNVPKGQGPWPTLTASAIDAFRDELKSKGWKAAPIGIADTLAFTERFNGLGYRNHGIDSAYNWGGTSEEDRGGYATDGVWSPNREETRVGVVAIMKELRRRELSQPGEPIPIPEVPANPPAQVYEKLLALAASSGCSSVPVKEMIDYHAKNIPTKKLRYWAVVDFSVPSSQKRFYLFDTVDMKVEKHLVSHGAGSDPNGTGMATKFSNVDGSHMSSLGIVKCAELYTSNGERRMRLDGLEARNSRVRSRAIVMHSASYVNESSGVCGRSWGCTVLDSKYLSRVVTALTGGSLMNLWKA